MNCHDINKQKIEIIVKYNYLYITVLMEDKKVYYSMQYSSVNRILRIEILPTTCSMLGIGKQKENQQKCMHKQKQRTSQ